MDFKEAIMVRTSCRSYLKDPIESEILESLKEKIEAVNAESQLTISWLEDGRAAMEGGKSYGLFKGVRSMLAVKGPSELPHLREKAGYYGQKLVLEAAILGLGTCWVGGTFDKSALKIPDNEELVCVITVGNTADKPTLKDRFIRGIIRRNTKTVDQLITSDVPLSKEISEAMELVQRAPTARNQQKVTFKLEKGKITAHVPDDYTFDLVDLGICKLHFECGAKGKFGLGNGASLEDTYGAELS